uniref:Uncharacterized protein n=1 Tax=Photinus pyralis TaxID=7054 RepID=A0A1Y1MHL5_PHOPY
MTKFAVFFVAALAFQATFAFPKYFEEGKLVNYLDEIQTEVKDLTLFLRNDFPENHFAVKTITWQFRQLAVVVDEIINKLHEEIFIHEVEGHHVFKQVTFMLREIHSSLKKMTLFTEMSDLHEVKKDFILCLETVYENIEKLVRLTYTTYPEFRFTLKYLLVDFMTTLHHIRSHFEHLMKTVEVEFTPKHLITMIHEYTRECTEMIKEFNHPMQMKVALRGYLRYVREIVYLLEKETIVGEKEFDLLMHTLTNKLREIVFPLMELTMTEEMIDMKVFRTKFVTYLFDIVGTFEQMIQYCETKHIPVEIKYFIEKMMYNYLYAVKNVCYEMRFGSKIGFYMPEYYTMNYYGKYGYGLYETMFRKHFLNYDMGMHTLFPMHKYFMGKYEKMYTPMFTKMHDFDMEYYNKYGMEMFSRKYGMNKYFKEMPFEFESKTPKELVMHMEMLVKRVVENFEYRTMNVNDESTLYYIREFLTCLDLIYNRLESVTYTDMMVREFLMNLKEMKMELEKMISMRMFHNVHEIRMYFVRSIKMVATELYRIVMVEKFETKHFDHEMLRHILAVYMNFLTKFHTKYSVYGREYMMPTTFGLNTHKEMIVRMHTLTEKIMESFKYDTVEMKHMTVLYIRNFIEIIDYVIEKMHITMMGKLVRDETVMRDIFMHLKQMRTEFEHLLTFDAMDMHKMTIRFEECLRMFTMQMEKLTMFEVEYPILVKEICMRYVMILENFYHKISMRGMEVFPTKNFRTMYHDVDMKRMMPFHFNQEMKY